MPLRAATIFAAAICSNVPSKTTINQMRLLRENNLSSFAPPASTNAWVAAFLFVEGLFTKPASLISITTHCIKFSHIFLLFKI